MNIWKRLDKIITALLSPIAKAFGFILGMLGLSRPIAALYLKKYPEMKQHLPPEYNHPHQPTSPPKLPSSGSKEAVESFTTPGVYYHVDIDQMTCTCPDWQKRRSHYTIGDPRRACKHIAHIFPSNNLPINHEIEEAAFQHEGVPLSRKHSRPNRSAPTSNVVQTPSGEALYSKAGFGNYKVEINGETFTYMPQHGFWKQDIVPEHDDIILKKMLHLPDDVENDAIQTTSKELIDKHQARIDGAMFGESISAVINLRNSATWHQVAFNGKEIYCNTNTTSLHKSKSAHHTKRKITELLHISKAVTRWINVERDHYQRELFPPKKPSQPRSPKLSDEELKERQRDRKREMRSKPVTQEVLSSFDELKAAIDPMLKEGSELVPQDRKKYFVAGLSTGSWLCRWYYKTDNKRIEINGCPPKPVENFNNIAGRFEKEIMKEIQITPPHS